MHKTSEVEVYIFKAGQKIREHRSGHPNGSIVWHILAIIDETQVAMKYWSKRKQWWVYDIKDDYELTLAIDDGGMQLIEKEA